ncbi:hypothetical protein AMS68_005297 [Peltaster fructicola]|uniref:PXA domain-containing protein n=1 Tax=Peltaster fructicola TaxID=286661 RepID=A0A6H0XZE4_9PEZI|nr:hypothetical protein AMS68_005297 [Peltaster fructicola]
MDELRDETPLATEHTDESIPLPPVIDTSLVDKQQGKQESVQASQLPTITLVQRCTDSALHFLAHASNQTLGACLVGFGATTYFVLGRVGLVIIGVASGVVLQATWEGIRQDDRSEEVKTKDSKRRQEAGIEVVQKLLQWREGQKEEGNQEESAKSPSGQDLDFSTFEPETGEALNKFADAVIKDYVKYWYAPTIPGEESFPSLCRNTLTAFILSMSGHLRRKRPADAFLDFVTNASSIIVVFLNELSAALNASPSSSAQDAVSTYLELKPESNLASLLDTRNQDRKLKTIAEDILESYLEPKVYNCPPVHGFLKEVLAQLVLGYTITLCSAPDWINDYIIYGLEESDTTKEVMNIVDAGVEGRSVDSKPMSQMDEPAAVAEETTRDHKRQASKAEDPMDEAMREAQRLTQLMIEEDERRAREEAERQSVAFSVDDVSEVPSRDVRTPTSSDSERERADNDLAAEQEVERPSTPTTKAQFTSFDQILPSSQPTALMDTAERAKSESAVLTLHNATISIFDDSVPGERATIKARPTTDYLIQIEPSSAVFPGWMIARKYADFEMLHEVLKRLSVITGVNFTERHAELPKWKQTTKASLRHELEQYLMAAVRYQQLAESEGMKRFLEKDQTLMKGPGKGFGWPTPEAFGKLGGDMINVLAKAPTNVAGGGKALFSGLKGKKNQSQASIRNSVVSTPGSEGRQSMSFPDVSEHSAPRASQDSLQPPSEGVDKISAAPRPLSAEVLSSPSRRPADLTRAESYASQPSPVQAAMPIDPMSGIEDTFDLPPPPSEMPDDYGVTSTSMRQSIDALRTTREASLDLPPAMPPRPVAEPEKPTTTKKPPITERETSVAVELMFAVITELFTLSSAWQFRRTLLAAAKSFLLRPGNPQLLAIRDLLQKDLLDANLSDAGVAAQVIKLRENALPTAEELEIWNRDYPPKTAEQKEEARIKARRLLVTKGMPAALTSVMGAAASGEALGNVFDCLQIPEVSRGLVFGLMLQALKVVTH